METADDEGGPGAGPPQWELDALDQLILLLLAPSLSFELASKTLEQQLHYPESQLPCVTRHPFLPTNRPGSAGRIMISHA